MHLFIHPNNNVLNTIKQVKCFSPFYCHDSKSFTWHISVYQAAAKGTGGRTIKTWEPYCACTQRYFLKLYFMHFRAVLWNVILIIIYVQNWNRFLYAESWGMWTMPGDFPSKLNECSCLFLPGMLALGLHMSKWVNVGEMNWAVSLCPIDCFALFRTKCNLWPQCGEANG